MQHLDKHRYVRSSVGSLPEVWHNAPFPSVSFFVCRRAEITYGATNNYDSATRVALQGIVFVSNYEE